MGHNIQKASLVALEPCAKEFAVDAPSLFRVALRHRKGVCVLCRYPVSDSGAEGVERPQALGTLE